MIRARTLAQREASREYVARYRLEHPRVDLRVLDFDHRPEAAKSDGVMQLVRNGFAIDAIEAEISKCDVRCRNCHAIVTYERMGSNWRSQVMSERRAGA